MNLTLVNRSAATATQARAPGMKEAALGIEGPAIGTALKTGFENVAKPVVL